MSGSEIDLHIYTDMEIHRDVKICVEQTLSYSQRQTSS